MSHLVLVDTGPLVALRDADDHLHEACKAVLGRFHGPLVTCWPVLTEAAYLLRDKPAEVRGLLAAATEPSFMEVLPIGRGDIAPINALLKRYEDLGLQLADACLLHLAELIGAEEIFTTDRRDFGAAVTASGRSLRILPE